MQRRQDPWLRERDLDLVEVFVLDDDIQCLPACGNAGSSFEKLVQG